MFDDNHPDVSKTKAIASSHLCWPQIDQDIEKIVGASEACLVVKAWFHYISGSTGPGKLKMFILLHVVDGNAK